MVLLISLYRENLNENLGIQQISAFLNNTNVPNKIIYYSIQDGLEPLQAYVENDSISMIGISLYGENFEFAKKISCFIKQRKNIPIFYGSQFATLSYQYILDDDPWVDFVVLGQGEYPIYDFICAYNGNNTQEIVSQSPYLASKHSRQNKRPYKTHIDNLPWPTHESQIIKRNFFVYLNTSQGCLGNCSFCGTLRNVWSGRTPEAIANEISRLHKAYGVRAFSFSDCSFEDPGELGKQRLSKWSDLMKASDQVYAFQAFLRADSLQSKDLSLLYNLKTIGLNQFVIGIEAGNEADLRVYGKRAHVSDNIRTLHLLKRSGIFAFIGFIMMNPFSTFETMRANYEFLCQYHGFFPASFSNHLILYENTRVFETVKQRNQLLCLDKHRFDYKINDEYAQQLKDTLFSKIEKSEMPQDMVKLQSDLRLIHFIFALCKDVGREKMLLGVHLEEMRQTNIQFFRLVYEEQRVFEALTFYYEYHEHIKNICTKIDLLKRVLYKKFLLESRNH